MNKKHAIAVLIIIVLLIGGILANAHRQAESNSIRDETMTSVSTPTDTNTADNGAGSSEPSCGYTPETTAGPYYIANTKQLTEGNMNYNNLPGDKIKVSGYVYGADDNTKPLGSAKVEIWQADSNGNYHPEKSGSADQYTNNELDLRGYVITDSNGYYEFTSILPAEYEGRPRHIHARASGDGYKPVTTQMIAYQPQDKVRPSADPIARSLPSCSLLTFTDIDGVKTASFDFHILENK